MTIEQLKNPSAGELDALTGLWESSVRATHDFLAAEDISFFRQMVRREALAGVELYVIRETDSKSPEAGPCGEQENRHESQTCGGQENRHESQTCGGQENRHESQACGELENRHEPQTCGRQENRHESQTCGGQETQHEPQSYGKTGEPCEEEVLSGCGLFGGFAAFAGIEGNMLEMLFVAPHARGKGLGRQLVEYLVRERGIRRVDVNEQNTQAVRFYARLEFRATGRDATDSSGRPYPILHLSLGQTQRRVVPIPNVQTDRVDVESVATGDERK